MLAAGPIIAFVFALASAPAAEAEDPADRLAEALLAATGDEQQSLLTQARDTPGIVAALMRRGDTLAAERRHEPARVTYSLALQLAEARADRVGSVRARRGLGACAWQLGRPEALDELQRSLALAEEADLTGEMPETLRQIGIVHRDRGDHAIARDTFERSVRLAEAAGDDNGAARTLNSLGQLYSQRGDFPSAFGAYEKSLAIRRRLGDRRGVADTSNNIGAAHHRRGEYTLALRRYEETLAIRDALGDRRGLAETLNNIGVAHRRLGHHPLALEFGRRALAEYKALGQRSGLMDATSNLAIVQQLMGDAAGAQRSFEESLALSRALERRSAEGAFLQNLGQLRCAQGDFGAGLDFFAQRLALAERMDDRAAQAAAKRGMAEAYGEQGALAKSLQLAVEAVSLADRSDARETRWRAHTAAARAHRRLGRPQDAEAAAEAAIATVEALRREVLVEPEVQQRFFESRTAPYHEKVELLAALGRTDDALIAAQQAKARALRDVLQGGPVRLTKAMTDAERAEEQALRVRLVESADEEARERARREYEAFRTRLYLAHPELAIHRVDFPPPDAADIKALVTDAQAAVLEYVVTRDSVHLFVLAGRGDPSGARIERIGLEVTPRELSERVTAFRRSLADRDLAFKRPARALYDVLIRPVEPLLAGKTAVTIAPDGPLWELPFQALLSEDGRFLWERFALANAPSIGVMRAMRTAPAARRPKPSIDLLAFADPIGAPDDTPPLPEARTLARRLTRLHGATSSRAYVGEEASEARLKSEGGRCRILHLGTHGVFNDANPLYSHVRLAPTAGEQDGRLEAWEILDLELAADLTVLTACESGRGHVGSGEGLVGLTWALFVAGSPTTVVSQWRVDAASATTLMARFHRSFQNGADAARALREAGLALRRDPRYAHPFYWAPFVVVGSRGPS